MKDKKPGAEDIRHYVYKQMIRKAQQELMVGKKAWTYTFQEEVRAVDSDIRPDVILWYGKIHSMITKKVFFEVQGNMKDKAFLEKIEYYKAWGWDYEIIEKGKMPGTYDEDFEVIKGYVESHLPKELKA